MLKRVVPKVQRAGLSKKRPRIELGMRDIVAHPGERKPIDNFHHDIWDEARRAYLQIGPYRPNSSMNIIKTERRNKMNDDLLNSSMMCYIERDLFASIEDEKILKRFQGLRNCKMNLPNEGSRCVLFTCISLFQYIMLSCFING